jgi:hypothetical protein
MTGTVQQFTATGSYSDSSTQIVTNSSTWSSSNSGVAAISNAAGSRGLATSIANGAVTITATVGLITGTAMLNVTTTGSAELEWDAPTTNADGSPLTNLAGFKVYYGNAPGVYTQTIDVGNIRSYSVSGLAPGTYYFTVTAYYTTMAESGHSNEVNTLL